MKTFKTALTLIFVLFCTTPVHANVLRDAIRVYRL